MISQEEPCPDERTINVTLIDQRRAALAGGAEEASTIADSMQHPESRQMWEGIAREYAWMADQAARRAG